METPMEPGIEVLSKKYKRDDNDTILCTDRIQLRFDGRTLDLAQSWEDGEELAPIFSGACWAGTVVWKAALDLCDYMSGHLRTELVGATVVELGCGIGVPGMIARLLGATVILTEQDELLSLLDKNITYNFSDDGEGGVGIRRAALDWERGADTDDILASLRRHPERCSRDDSESHLRRCARALEEKGCEGLGALAGKARGADSEEGEDGQELSERTPTQLDFLLCADCVFEPLYGTSWKALAQVMGRLSDAGTTILCSFERRGDDGVPKFLKACEAEGFTMQMVFCSSPDTTPPIEIHEFSKSGRRGLRGVAVNSEKS